MAIFFHSPFQKFQQLLIRQAQIPGLPHHPLDVVLIKPLPPALAELLPGAEATNIPTPRFLYSSPASTSRLIPFRAVAGLIRYCTEYSVMDGTWLSSG